MENEILSQPSDTEENYENQSGIPEKPPEFPESASLEAELAESRAEVRRLSALLSQREQADRETADFAEYFPEVSRDEIPDAVRERAARENIPLVAAYALYDRKLELAKMYAGDVARKSAECSAGPVSGASREADFFTMEQIRAMTPKEVKKHYKTIMKSLNKG